MSQLNSTKVGNRRPCGLLVFMTAVLVLATSLSSSVSARSMPEPEVDEVTVRGHINGSNITFAISFEVTTLKRNQMIRILGGDLVLEEIQSPSDGYTLEYDLESRSYQMTFPRKGSRRVELTMAVRPRPLDHGAWREASFVVPPSRVRQVEIISDRTELEVKLPGAVRVERYVVNNELSITAMQGGQRPFTLRWKPQVQELDAKLVLSSHANTIAIASAGALRIDTLFGFDIAQGKLEELLLWVPGSLNVTQVRGEHIRDWKLEAGADASGRRRLTVSLNRARSKEYALQILSEMVFPAFPVQVKVPVIEPADGIRAGGHLAIGTDSAIQMVVQQTGGLSQIDAPAMPRVVLNDDHFRPLPVNKAFYYTYASSPYQMAIKLDNIVPAYDTVQRVVMQVNEDELSVVAEIELDVREAPVREVLLQVPAGLMVVAVTGAQVDDYRVLPANDGSIPVRVQFREPLLGHAVLKLNLELGRTPLDSSFKLGTIAVSGAKTHRGFLVVAVEDGVHVDTPIVQNLRQINTASVPVKVARAQYAYRFREPGWSLRMMAQKKPAGIRVESFHVVSLGEGVTYGNVAINYFITGSPVDELGFIMSPELKNVEFVGSDVRRWQQDEDDPQRWTVKLQRKVIGDYNLGVTYTQRYQDGGSILVGSVRCDQVETQMGYIAVASHLNVKLTTSAETAEGLLEIERDEIPANYRLLVNAPLLQTYKYVSTPHQISLQVDAYQRGSLLPVVIEFMEVETKIAARSKDNTESFTRIRYKVKNSSSQFLTLSMPKGATVWATRIIQDDGRGGQNAVRVTSSFDNARGLLMIPLRRPRDPNTPVTIELEYGQIHTPLNTAGDITLAAPVGDVRSTYDSWTLTVPDKWAIHPVSGSMQSETRVQNHGDISRVLLSVGQCWASALSRVTQQQQLLTVGLGVAGVLLLVLIVVRQLALDVVVAIVLVLAVWVGVVAARSSEFTAKINSTDDLTRLAYTQVVDLDSDSALNIAARVVPQWRQYASVIDTIVIPAVGLGCLGFATLLHHIRVIRAFLAAIGVAALLFGAGTLPIASPYMGHLLTWGIPALLAALFFWRVLRHRIRGIEVRPAAATAGVLILLASMTAGNADASEVVEALPVSPPPPPPVMIDSVVADFTAEEDNMAVQLKLEINADGRMKFALLDEHCILISAESSSKYLQVVEEGGRHFVEISKGGPYELTVNALRPLPPADLDQRRQFKMPLPVALRKHTILTVPELGIEVQMPTAIRADKSERDGSTIMEAVIAPDSDVQFSWKPRARLRELEDTSFFTTITTAVYLDAGVVRGFNDLVFQIAQGQLEQIHITVPDSMTVTAVEGAGLGTWRFDPATHLIEARLSRPASGEYRLRIVTQSAANELPYTIAFGSLQVRDTTGQRGTIGVLASGSVYASIPAGHPPTINVDDFARDTAELVALLAPEDARGVRFAYRFENLTDQIVAVVHKVHPELRSTEDASFAVADERLVYNGTFVVNIAKSGLFSVNLIIPEGFDIDTLSAAEVSHWDELTVDNKRVITVHFTRKVLGQVSLQIALSRPISELPRQLNVPRIECVDALKHTGRVVISVDRGVRLTVANRSGVSELNPLELGIRATGALAFRLLRPNWDLTLATEQVEPRITVDFLHVAKVTEGLVRHTYYLRYNLHHAGAKQFQVQLPAGAVGQLITGPTIARLEEVTPGSGLWQVELAGKWFDRPYPLTIQYETQFVRASGDIQLLPVDALGIDLHRGYVTILANDRVEVAQRSVSSTLQVAEARTVPRDFGAGDLAHAVLCYRTANAAYDVGLRATRHGSAAQLEADVLSTTITTVVTERGESINSVKMQLRVGSKRHLETRLPDGAEVWSLLVNGRASVPSIRLDKNKNPVILVPLAQTASGDLPVQVDLAYVVPGTGTSWRRPNFDGPRFDLPLKDVRWVFYLPEGYVYDNFDGTLEVDERSVERGYVAQYSAGTYQTEVQKFKEGNLRKAAELQQRANLLAGKGEQRAAKQALESAWYYSLSDEALNEDARVQLHRLNSDQAVVGLVGSRKRLRQQTGAAANQVDNVPGELGERFDQDAVRRIRSSLSKDDSENLQLICARIIETQEAAAGASVPLVVSIPLRGRVVEFRRAIQVEPNTDMAIAFDAKPTVSSRIKVGYLWAGGMFAVLLVVFLAAGPLQQRYAAISENLTSHHAPDSDFDEIVEDDDESTIDV